MAESIAERGADLVQQSGGITPFIRDYGIGGILFAIFINVIGIIDAAGELLLAPFRALAGGLSALVGGTLGAALDVVAEGSSQTIDALGTGATELIGPFAFPLSVAIAMLAVYAFVFFVARLEFSPFIFIRNTARR